MDLKEVLEGQIKRLDEINKELAVQVIDKTAAWPIGEIRQNTELIRGLVKDITMIEDARGEVKVSRVQTAAITGISGE